MRLNNINQVDDFISKVRGCAGDVWLESNDGNKINLKSSLSMYVALGALLTMEGDKLELYCAEKEDEIKFLEFFDNYQDTL